MPPRRLFTFDPQPYPLEGPPAIRSSSVPTPFGLADLAYLLGLALLLAFDSRRAK